MACWEQYAHAVVSIQLRVLRDPHAQHGFAVRVQHRLAGSGDGVVRLDVVHELLYEGYHVDPALPAGAPWHDRTELRGPDDLPVGIDIAGQRVRQCRDRLSERHDLRHVEDRLRRQYLAHVGRLCEQVRELVNDDRAKVKRVHLRVEHQLLNYLVIRESSPADVALARDHVIHAHAHRGVLVYRLHLPDRALVTGDDVHVLAFERVRDLAMRQPVPALAGLVALHGRVDADARGRRAMVPEEQYPVLRWEVGVRILHEPCQHRWIAHVHLSEALQLNHVVVLYTIQIRWLLESVHQHEHVHRFARTAVPELLEVLRSAEVQVVVRYYVCQYGPVSYLSLIVSKHRSARAVSVRSDRRSHGRYACDKRRSNHGASHQARKCLQSNTRHDNLSPQSKQGMR